jgi:phosphohistidine phosphatase
MWRIAEGMKALDLWFDLILSSPYVRAKQTADIVVQVFKAQDKLEMSTALTPDGDPEELMAELNRHYRALDSILLVGHEPSMSSLISMLVAGDSSLSMVLKKGGLCKLTAPSSLRYGRCAALEWLLTPRQLRLMS